jgi:DNA-directed RNA polymerase specialized sigma24 family protein
MMLDLDQHLAAIQQGDADAFGRWAAGVEPTLRSSLRAFAAAVDTEAVLQETLLRIWQVAPRFEADGRPNGLLRLALRSARNLAISETRRRRARPAEPEDLETWMAIATEHSDTPADPLLRRAIEGCREKLPNKPAEALEARLQSAGGEPDEVLAERLGQRLNTFLQNFTRARKMLAECLQRQGIAVEEVLS